MCFLLFLSGGSGCSAFLPVHPPERRSQPWSHAAPTQLLRGRPPGAASPPGGACARATRAGPRATAAPRALRPHQRLRGRALQVTERGRAVKGYARYPPTETGSGRFRPSGQGSREGREPDGRGRRPRGTEGPPFAAAERKPTLPASSAAGWTVSRKTGTCSPGRQGRQGRARGSTDDATTPTRHHTPPAAPTAKTRTGVCPARPRPATRARPRPPHVTALSAEAQSRDSPSYRLMAAAPDWLAARGSWPRPRRQHH